jgi:hypothetical protein
MLLALRAVRMAAQEELPTLCYSANSAPRRPLRKIQDLAWVCFTGGGTGQPRARRGQTTLTW